MNKFFILAMTQLCMAVNLCHYNVFNWVFYLNMNKNLVIQGINDQRAACEHWKAKGVHQGIIAHPMFSVETYCSRNRDVRMLGYCTPKTYPLAINHYLTIGMKEGKVGYRQGGELFIAKSEKFSAHLGIVYGASIFSIMYNNQTQIVNSYDHGRQLQYTINSTNELFRANQAGSESDGIYSNSSTKLDFMSGDDEYNEIASYASPAYWKTRKVKTLPYKICSSTDILGVNAFRYRMHFEKYNYPKVEMEVPRLSMMASFSTVYEVDLTKKTYNKIDLPKPGTFRTSDKPLIFENGENVAIGMRFDSAKGAKDIIVKYLYYGRFGSNIPIDRATKMSILIRGVTIPQEKIEMGAIVGVGTPKGVFEALTR